MFSGYDLFSVNSSLGHCGLESEGVARIKWTKDLGQLYYLLLHLSFSQYYCNPDSMLGTVQSWDLLLFLWSIQERLAGKERLPT